jgi:hypothetical protein
MIMQDLCFKMLLRQKDELERTDVAEKDAVSAETASTAD